ncbi:MAG: DUF2267 domain-containing protein [Candidatus Zixiibacteriota bacterium]|nr:MAG: DUF2267 domain-containing protein [candidate division Zixibacteria bacterium]
MQYDEIIQTVQDACELESSETSRAVETFFETIGERLNDSERNRLADQLPGELKECLYRRPHTVPFGLEEFYNRIAARQGLRYAAAVERIRCVAGRLQHTISEGDMERLRGCLQDDYAELFGRPPRSPLSPSAV